MTVAQLLVGTGVFAVVASSVCLLLVRDRYLRLHALAPASTLGVPLVIAGVLFASGPVGDATAKLVVVLVLLTLTGPVATTALARATAYRDHLVESEPPE